MPAFIYALLVGLVPVLTGWVFQILLALGVGFVTYTGVSAAFDSLHGLIVAQYSSLTADLIGILGLMRVDQAVNLIISACTVRLTLQGLTGGGLRRMVFKAPS